MPKVRRIQPGDGVRLRELRLRALESDPRAFGSTYEREVDLPLDIWESRATASSSGPSQYIAVADAGDVFVGLAGGYLPEERPGERAVWGMWVAPEWRRRALGRRLAEDVVDWARRAEADRVTLWVVASNIAAVGLYEQLGFADTGRRQALPSDPSLDEIAMWLQLGES